MSTANSTQSSTTTYLTAADLPPPNKSGNSVGMVAFVTTADEGEDIAYTLAPRNAGSDPATGYRWVPFAVETSPYYT